MRMLKSKKGLSIMEVMVALALLGVVGGMMAAGITEFSKAQVQVRALSASDKQVASLIENVRSNLSLIQSSSEIYDYTKPESERLSSSVKKLLEDLPVAWSQGMVTTPEECPQCPGRLGFVMMPVMNFPGLYIVHMRITNGKLFQGVKEYKFYATYK